MLPNAPAMIDAHYGVPMLGAVLNTINTRLDAETVAYILEHGEAKVLITDRQFAGVVGPALKKVKRKIHVVDVDDPLYAGPGERVGGIEYEDFIAAGDPAFKWRLPEDEYAPIALNYTSGTTGRPKGVVYHHRGTFLEAMGHVAAWAMPMHPVYLWTLPLFHCNGWAFAWTTVAMCGTQVCLRAVDPALIFPLIEEHGVTHMCGAPTVLTMLTSAPPGQRRAFPHPVHIQTGGSPPPAKVIQAMESLGFKVLHIYGMTELQGPSTLCLPQAHWAALPLEERANLMARQGVRYQVVEGHIVGDPRTCRPVPQDGETIGEVLIQGNTVMLGYLKDEQATQEAFHGGWMHTGDLAVWHPGGYVEIKDRRKDIIISGGENISSVEVEIALYRHPATQLAAPPFAARAPAVTPRPKKKGTPRRGLRVTASGHGSYYQSDRSDDAMKRQAERSHPPTPNWRTIMLNLKTLISGLALAASFASFNALAADDWHRSTGGVPPQAMAEEFYARGTGGVSPNAIGDEFYFRGTGGVSPAIAEEFFSRGTGGVSPGAISDEFYTRGTGGVSPQAHGE